MLECGYNEIRSVMCHLTLHASTAWGYPVALVFHGWYLYPQSTFKAQKSDCGVFSTRRPSPFFTASLTDSFNKAKTAAALLADGSPIAPAASADMDAWQTNISPWQLMPLKHTTTWRR